jgi:hypothetical protein
MVDFPISLGLPGTIFAVAMGMDVTMKARSNEMDEIAVYSKRW